MPSVEMRRSTRVFVPKAKDELVRVLRSGRRLRVESAQLKNNNNRTTVDNGDEWFPLIPPPDTAKCKRHKINPISNSNDWQEHHHPHPHPHPEDKFSSFRDDDESCNVSKYNINNNNNTNMFRNVYSRKRKRLNVTTNLVDFDSKKFGLHFVRRQRRTTTTPLTCLPPNNSPDDHDHAFLSLVLESQCVGCLFFSTLLSSLLTYITKHTTISLPQLSTFLLSTPFSTVFQSSGIRFFQNGPLIKSKGFCRIFGMGQFTALFTVDFSAAPLCFLHIHATLLFRSVRLFRLRWIKFDPKNDTSDAPIPCINHQNDSSLRKLVAPATDDCKDVNSLSSSPLAAKFCSRNVQCRIGVLTRSASKRRRRSLRNRRARNPLPFIMQKSTGIPVSNSSIRKNTPTSPPLSCKRELRRSVRKSSVSEVHVQDTGSSALNVDIDSQCCSVNILVVEADKCYRVEGAEVKLDISASSEWLLVVKKNGSIRYSFKVQREMRQSSTNRFTHAMVWAGENGWKLEFPDRKDWTVFKELYKVCGERNIVPTSPVVKNIPVPGVCEVTTLWDPPCAFKRPESYIRMTSDELSRTLSRRTANYDMDSEDEEWLNKFNSELEASKHLSDDSFELIIDTFEKASYCSPEVVNDDKAAPNPCLGVSQEVTELLYRYWMKKRKQKRAPLNRVFQLNQPTRAQLITKPVLRKKRSLKRPTLQSIQRGRGKDSSVLQVIAAEHIAAEEQSAFLRVQEAKASADKSVELAIRKRQRAQLLMENADLAMYRATMALRIADAAGEILDLEQAADHFLN